MTGPSVPVGTDTTAFEVPPELAGERLDKAVAALSNLSRTQAAAAIDDGRVQLEGRAVARSTAVVAGQRLILQAAAVATPTPPPPLPPVLHDDEHFLVVDKPAGLVVHPGAGHPDGTLADALAAGGVSAGPDPTRPGIVHRLDRDTSGAMVVARNDRAHAALQQAIAQRRVARHYLALVTGRLPATHGVVDVPIGRDERMRTRFVGRADGRDARTRFVVVATGSVAVPQGGSDGSAAGPVGQREVSLVACALDTGRTHQIRVHMAHAGCPVVADDTYGAPAALGRALGLARMWLHATHLQLPHPITGDHVEVVAPIPTDLQAALDLATITPPVDLSTLAWP